MKNDLNLKSYGICSLEEIDCGCKIRRYVGGRIITIGCNDHTNKIEYVCPVCKKKLSKKQLKECRWSHAI